MSACRYERGPCTYPTLRRHYRCQDGSCPEQAGRDASRPDDEKSALVYVAHSPEPQKQPTKPAAPVVVREEEAVPTGIPADVGMCGNPECSATGKLYRSQHYDGARCKKCHKRASNAAARTLRSFRMEIARGSKPKKPAKAASVKPAPTTAQPPTNAPIAQKRPPRDPVTGFRLDGKPEVFGPPAEISIPNPRFEQETGTGLTFSFRVTLEPGLTVESMVEILRALPAGAVLVW